jgi:hypothetical protein
MVRRGIKVSSVTKSTLRVGPRYQVCFGIYPIHFNQLKDWSRRRKTSGWTVNSSARAGDVALFYMQRPFTGIVATGEFAGPANKTTRGPWPGKFMAPVGSIKMLPCPIQLKDLKLEMSEWGWLKYPRRSTTVPAELEPKMTSLLQDFSAKPTARGSEMPHPRGIPAEIMEKVFKRDGGRCRNCGASTNIQFDHILPWSKGGTSLSVDNVQVLCISCNAKKSDRFV